MPNYLGIDYGTKRIGLAWADELLISLPAGAIAGVDREGCWEALTGEVATRSITDFVVGYPVHMDGEIGACPGGGYFYYTVGRTVWIAGPPGG